MIKILGVDPSLRNLGLATFSLNLDTLELDLLKLRLVQTDGVKKADRKLVRRNSDDLRRSEELHRAFHEEAKGCTFIFSEIPTGAQSARAALSFGVAIGILASHPVPLIQVMPSEVKIATAGALASKEKMIAWAYGLYPNCPDWLRARGKADGALINDNEHLADACGVAHAGLLTDEFMRARAMMGTRLAA